MSPALVPVVVLALMSARVRAAQDLVPIATPRMFVAPVAGYGYWEGMYGQEPYYWSVPGPSKKRYRYPDGKSLKDRQRELWRAWKEPINAAYPPDRIVGIAQAAARETELPFEWIMGTIMMESSGFKNRGGTYGSNGIPGPSFHDLDSGQGLAQMQIGMFDSAVRNSLGQGAREGSPKPKPIWWKHSDLINPQLSVWTLAYRLRGIVDNRHYRGQLDRVKPGDVGSWWAGKVSWAHAQKSYETKLAKWQEQRAAWEAAGRSGEEPSPPRKPGGMKREEYYFSGRIRALKVKDVSHAMQPGDGAFPIQAGMTPAPAR